MPLTIAYKALNTASALKGQPPAARHSDGLEEFAEIEHQYLPRLCSQVDDYWPNLRYPQALTPSLFTIARNGWSRRLQRV